MFSIAPPSPPFSRLNDYFRGCVVDYGKNITQEVRDEKQALFESWKSTLEREVAAAKAAVIQEV